MTLIQFLTGSGALAWMFISWRGFIHVRWAWSYVRRAWWRLQYDELRFKSGIYDTKRGKWLNREWRW